MDNTINMIANASEYIIIFALILTIIWMVYERQTLQKKDQLEWINQGHPSGKYGSFNPSERLNDIIGIFGDPDVLDKTKGGVAIWKKETLENKGYCWDRVELRDEQVPHNNPGPHVDFLYYWYKLYVPEELMCEIVKLSESITYDPLKKMLRVRCHANGANLATAVLAKRIANKETTLEKAKKDYGPLIFSTIKKHEMYNKDAEPSMLKELCDFKSQQKWKI